MMTDRLYIDDVDVYADYGVYITSEGLNQLIAFPPLKSVTSNDWQEEDGIEVDLSAPVLDTHEATLTLAVASSDAHDIECMVAVLLSASAYHEFRLASIGRSYRLRLVSQPQYEYGASLTTCSLKVADDFPLRLYSYVAPLSTIVPQIDDYLLDGVPLTTYGVRVLNGTFASVLQLPEVKSNMLRNISTVAGAIYGDNRVTYKSKDVKVMCLLRAASLDELWRNWDALLYNLTLPGERVLYIYALHRDYYCYYKSCTVSAFSPLSPQWLQCTLTLTFTRGFRDITYEAPVVVLAYPDMPYTGGTVLPTYSYSQAWYDSLGGSGTLTAGGTLTFGNAGTQTLSSINIDSATGAATYSASHSGNRALIGTAFLEVSMNGKTGRTTADIYVAAYHGRYSLFLGEWHYQNQQTMNLIPAAGCTALAPVLVVIRYDTQGIATQITPDATSYTVTAGSAYASVDSATGALTMTANSTTQRRNATIALTVTYAAPDGDILTLESTLAVSQEAATE